MFMLLVNNKRMLLYQLPVLIMEKMLQGPPQSFAADVGLATTTYPETKTLEVTVVSDGGNKFAIDSVSQKSLTLYQGSTYIFDLSSSTTASHPFKLSRTQDGDSWRRRRVHRRGYNVRYARKPRSLSTNSRPLGHHWSGLPLLHCPCGYGRLSNLYIQWTTCKSSTIYKH